MGHDEMCFVCGTENSNGMKVDFKYDSTRKVTYADYVPKDYLQSYDGVLHGGIQSAIMDSAMCNLLTSIGVNAVTAKLNMRYRKQVDDHNKITVEAKVLNRKDDFYFTQAEIRQNNILKTTCRGTFRKISGVM